MNLSPVKPTNRVEQAAEQLTRAVLTGRYAVGTLLPPERILTEQLGVSRSVVREATRVLQSRGLVESRQGTGTVVLGLSAAPVREAFQHALTNQDSDAERVARLLEARWGLEIQIAALAAARANVDEVALLRASLAAFTGALTDLPHCAELDVEFHRLLARSTHNPLFVMMLEPLSQLLFQTRLLSLRNSRPEVALGHHEAIVVSVEAADAQGAVRAMQHHLQVAMEELDLSVRWVAPELVQVDFRTGDRHVAGNK